VKKIVIIQERDERELLAQEMICGEKLIKNY
jgi:hypothetical protein